ncbi:MAG: translation initiation factor IF-2 subunit beta [Candidatus Thermoplasmatota archaeon]|nr:translation initiation factor IF-2 subunit beta [Candidatus Thermoplasmatota archaeon]
MSTYDYKDLLKKVYANISVTSASDDRFKLPEAEIFYEGNTTVIKNFDKISDAVNRDPDHILKVLLGGVGSAGERVAGRVIFQGKIPAGTVQEKLKDYIDLFVICSECGKPDTHIVKRGRNTMIRCDACGAIHPLKSSKKKTERPTSVSISEGTVCEVTIKDIGKKGDGVAFLDKYIIYVPGSVKGATVKVKIQKISGTMAFAQIIES